MHKELEKLVAGGVLTSKMGLLAQGFIDSYIEAAEQKQDLHINYRGLTETLIACVVKQLKDPYLFPVYHQKITEPFNYAQFSKDFIAPMIEEESSTIEGIENIDKLSSLIALGENAVILYNHQTEPDPQIIALMLEKRWSALTESMVFIAGHRVTEDPLAVPFSMGCNLLCVYSKKHLDTPVEEKEKKILHNRRYMHSYSSERGARSRR
jgi:glycerol-3-phosphate O-acyltransferase